MEITCEGRVTIRLTENHAVVALGEEIKVKLEPPDADPPPPSPNANTFLTRTTTGTCPRHGTFSIVERYDCEAGRWSS